ncbi:hypothetical protein DSO57_1036060 [Entomophthora muscae]|uniref:Uncharacterized protein n=1 Tax=Entomophthora muscae TaxID=34485 RepID=A0ACC2SNB6_9FUNG|nr:hypothetical protein DSO57_1036060 [Entomophthora muscae]
MELKEDCDGSKSADSRQEMDTNKLTHDMSRIDSKMNKRTTFYHFPTWSHQQRPQETYKVV